MDLKEIPQKLKNIEFESLFDKRVLGIQISNDWLKIVECENQKEGVEVKNFGQSKIETEINQGKIVNLEKMKQILKKNIKNNNIKSKNATLSISNGLVYNKIVEVPKESAQIQESIEWKIEDAFAVDIQEVYYDYQKIGENDTGNLEFNVVVLDKKEGDKYIELLKSANLKVKKIEVNSISVNKLIRKYFNKEKVVGILNIEEFESSLSFFQNEHLIYNKNIQIVGKDINQDIREVYGKQVSNPVNFKEKNDILLDEKLSKKRISDLFYKVQHYINHFYSTHGEVIDKIYIVGKGLGMSNHFKEISKELEMVFDRIDFYELINEGNNITVKTFENFFTAISSTLNTNDYNLLSDNQKQINLSAYFKKYAINFNLKSIASILIMISIISLIPNYNQVLESRVEGKEEVIMKLEEELFILSEETGELESLKNEYKRLKNEPKEIRKTVGPKREWDGILKEIEKVLPEGSWISNFEIYDGDSFILEGYVYNQEILRQIEERSNESDFFKSVDIQSIRRDNISRRNREYNVAVEEDVYEFEIVGKLE